MTISPKEHILKIVANFPEDATWQEILERIHYIGAIREGLRELNEGKGIPHEEILKEVASWADLVADK